MKPSTDPFAYLASGSIRLEQMPPGQAVFPLISICLVSSTASSKSMILNQGSLASRGHLAMSGTLLVVTYGWRGWGWQLVG